MIRMIGMGVCLLLIAGATASDGSAQATPRRAPVVVVLTDTIPTGGNLFLVQRRVSNYPHDVIHLTRAGNAADLSAAIRALLAARAKDGPIPSEEQKIRLSARSTTLRAPFPWAKRVVSDLRGAQPLEVDGLGEITALLIWLPAFGQ